MGLITSMRRQEAIYWPPAAADAFGVPAHGALVELTRVPGGTNYRVRWEDRNEEFLAPDGTAARSKALVYVPVLPDDNDNDTIEIQVGGFLWLGARDDLVDETDPTANPGAAEIRRVDKLPDFKSRQFLRTAYL